MKTIAIGSAILLGGLLSIGFLVLAAFGILMDVNNISTSVEPGTNLSEGQLKWIEDNELLLEGEEILYYYAFGPLSIETDTSVVTKQYAGRWWTEDETGLNQGWLKLGEICSVEVMEAGSFFEDAVFRLQSQTEDSWLNIVVSIEGDRHLPMIERIKEDNAKRMTPEFKRGCDLGIDTTIWPPVRRANNVSADELKWLQQEGLMADDAQVLFLSSPDHFSIEKNGVLLTDQHIGRWWTTDEGEFEHYWYRTGEVCTVELEDAGSESQPSVHRLTSQDPEDWIRFPLSRQDGLDTDLIKQFKTMNTEQMTDAFKSNCSDVASPDEPPAQE